ncbi:hypothetical protein [Bradyrhizobium liaoningense]|uniref:hypothetical protein n=1 Tax=Bradyrhizobium liaoningense TaxID=43992 RepID=UPI001BA5997E|nr:hypothetical protein [Bradyrhizobium liaoningense]MBR0706955.1 hypothetical protein [Bradyrhizobium liaoningense]
MMKTIILLTSTVQHQAPIARLLLEHNPELRVCCARNERDLTSIEPDVLREARLVSFATDIAVPEKILLQLGYDAYKFHAVPLRYLGLLPPPADEDDADCISAIAQSMAIWPDARKIVGLETLTISNTTAEVERERLIFARIAHLFWRMASLIACNVVDLPGVIDHRASQRPAFALPN